MKNDTCPHCGSEEYSAAAKGLMCRSFQESGGSWVRSTLCLEREAHRKTCENAQREIERLTHELHAAQESEAVWKTERDKADQRRLEAEADMETYRNELLAISRDLECLQPHWEKLQGIGGWGQRISKTVQPLVLAWHEAVAEVEMLRDAFSHLTGEIECTPKCSSHQRVVRRIRQDSKHP